MSFIINPFRFGGTGYVIPQSCRFNDDDSAKLTFTPASTGSTTTGTLSVWVKRCNLGTEQIILDADNTSDTLFFNTSDKLVAYFAGGAKTLVTTQVFRDPAAWYHIVYRVDTTAGSADRLRLYVNGERITAFDTETQPTASQTFSGFFKNAKVHTIGTRTVAKPLDAYLAEFVLIDGISSGPDSFGKFDVTGNWVPIDVSELTFGTNGAWLDFHNAADLGLDVSGSFSSDIIDDTQTYSSNDESLGAASNAADGSSGTYWSTVRRHINWNNHRPDLKEDLAHLVQDIKRRICGIASAGVPLFSV